MHGSLIRSMTTFQGHFQHAQSLHAPCPASSRRTATPLLHIQISKIHALGVCCRFTDSNRIVIFAAV